MKPPFPPESPKHCPCGHTHVSWSSGEEEVYCWDCDKKYPLSDCFSGPELARSAKGEEDSEN